MLVKTPVRRARRIPARGFTLVELCVVIALVALIGAIATPGFATFVDSMAAKATSMDLVADLAAARAEALKRNAAVTVSPLGGDWANGWRVVSGDVVLGERGALRTGMSLSAPAAGVTFQPSGRLGDSDVAVANMRWSVASTTSDVQPRCIVITPTGSARVFKGTC